MYKKILVPTDGSEPSQEAVATAIDIARLAAAEIVVLSVAEPYPLVSAEAAMAIDLGVETEQRKQMAQQIVDRVAESARAAGVACRTVVGYSTLPHEAIVQAAIENQCDLIFMGAHGRRGLSRLLAGSVTQNVLAHATIAVMVLRPKIEAPKH
jgi:nucleotide-binding universal stress UspA family protein